MGLASHRASPVVSHLQRGARVRNRFSISSGVERVAARAWTFVHAVRASVASAERASGGRDDQFVIGRGPVRGDLIEKVQDYETPLLTGAPIQLEDKLVEVED